MSQQISFLISKFYQWMTFLFDFFEIQVINWFQKPMWLLSCYERLGCFPFSSMNYKKITEDISSRYSSCEFWFLLSINCFALNNVKTTLQLVFMSGILDFGLSSWESKHDNLCHCLPIVSYELVLVRNVELYQQAILSAWFSVYLDWKPMCGSVAQETIPSLPTSSWIICQSLLDWTLLIPHLKLYCRFIRLEEYDAVEKVSDL